MERSLRGPAVVLAVLLLGGAALDLLGWFGRGGVRVAALRVREQAAPGPDWADWERRVADAAAAAAPASQPLGSHPGIGGGLGVCGFAHPGRGRRRDVGGTGEGIVTHKRQ